MSVFWLIVVAVLYLGVIGYLGFRGYQATKSSADYLLAGRSIHPYIMALSYGAAFISTSAIVGFGGAAALFGMGLLWLTFLNILVGIFVAFIIFGKPTRRLGHRLQAHTFPELLGRRYRSRFIQAFSGLVIMLFMPLYAAAVLIGAARYIEGVFSLPYPAAVAVFSILLAGFVVAGGLKGVMYADALQGSLMFVGMLLLIVLTYWSLGGVGEAHRKLAELPDRIEETYQAVEPEIREAAPPGTAGEDLFGWFAGAAGQAGELKGLMAAVKDAETTEAEEAAQAKVDAFIAENPDAPKAGALLKAHPELASKLAVAGISKAGFQGWMHFPKLGSNWWYVLVTSIIAGVGIGVLAQPQLAVRFMTVKSSRELNRAVLVGGVFILMMTGVAFLVGNLSNVWFWRPENGGNISFMIAGKNIDAVMPMYITSAMPDWFGAIFMLTLMAAALSTLSSQFHAMGTAIGRDFFERGIFNAKNLDSTVLITRAGIIIAILATVALAFWLPIGIVAAATAIFFGLCASAFLPMYAGALFWKRMNRAGAIASLCVGFGVSFFWLMFVQQVKGKLPAVILSFFENAPDTLLPNPILGIHWNWLEALFVGLPLSILAAVVVSLITKPDPPEHIEECYGKD